MQLKKSFILVIFCFHKYVCANGPFNIMSYMLGMDAQVSFAFHAERKKYPEKFKNQLANQVYFLLLLL